MDPRIEQLRNYFVMQNLDWFIFRDNSNMFPIVMSPRIREAIEDFDEYFREEVERWANSLWLDVYSVEELLTTIRPFNRRIQDLN